MSDRVEGSGGAASDLNELLRRTLRRDLSLAAEHVHSILWLLEIARQHQQPIPRAALTNLGLVSKHLAEIERRIEAASGARQRVRTSSGESSSSSSSAANDPLTWPNSSDSSRSRGIAPQLMMTNGLSRRLLLWLIEEFAVTLFAQV